MKKGILLITILLFTALLISCGGGSSSSSSPPGVNTGIPSIVHLLPLQYVAQTNSYLYFKAKVLDGNGNPVANEPVIFTNLSLIGTLSTASVATQSSSTVAHTDEYGYATAKIFSSVPGFITVLAEVNVGTGKIRDRKTVFFTSSDTNIYLLPYMTLDVDSSPPNGMYNEPSDFYLFEETYDDTVEVIATVYDRWGQPAPGVSITWGTDQAEAVQLEPINSTTNINGQAKALIQDIPLSLRDTVTFLNVYAYAEVDAHTVANMVTLFLQPVAVDTSLTNLTADPQIVETGGESKITAVVFMTTGEPIYDGATINFTTTCGTITPFAQTTGGVAEATFTAPDTEGTCTITAKLRGDIIGTVDVRVIMALQVMPSTINIDGLTGGTATFTIYGGLPAYTVFSDNPLFPPVPSTVANSGDSFTVTVPAGTPDTTVTYTIMDSTGATVTATLEIGGLEPLSVDPTEAEICENDNTCSAGVEIATFIISGGSGSYTVTSDNTAVIPDPGSLAGNIFTVDAIDGSITNDTVVILTVTDNITAETVSVTVMVINQ